MRKRMLSIWLCLMMVTGLLPTALAVDEEGESDGGTTVQVDDGKAVIINDTTPTVYSTLDAAMGAANSGDTIYLGAGTYCGNTTNPTTAGKGAGKSLTFVGAGTNETTWQINAPATAYGSDGWCDYSFKNSDSIIFQNMTVVSSVHPDKTTKANDTQGLTYINHITLKNCIFNGRADYWGYETTTFENVIFNAPGTEESGISGTDTTNYSLWTYTGKTYTFKNCEFNSTGKTINVYRQGDPGYDVTVDFENCTVKNTAHKKQAMKINDSTMGEHKYTINISGNNKVEGIEPNAITCSRLFGFDEAGEDAGKTIVYIEGEKVWGNGERVGSHNHDFETGFYNNGVANNGVATDNANKYTDGYKDNAFTTTYGDWDFKQETGKFTRNVTKTCNYCGYTEKTTETKELELDVSRSKTATALDSSDQSTVTLSLPSAEENLATDVVLALDVSKCTPKTLPAVQSLLNDLSAVQKESGANIKIGIAMFKGSAVPFQKLVTLTPNKNAELQALFNQFLNVTGGNDAVEDAVRAYLKTHFDKNEYLDAGTNMPAGLLLAKEMLDEDTAVKANRKYMILVSDGSTYLFTHNNDYSTAWSRQHEPGDYKGGLYEFNWRCEDFLMGNDATAADWTRWLESVGEFSKTFADEYDYEWKGANTSCENQIPNSSDNVKYLINGDTSIYQSAMFYKQMQEDGYNCYYCYAYDSEDNYGRNALRSLNDDAHLIDGANTQNVFSSIENDIIFAVGAGSVVEDKMGDDFDFVPGSLKLTVGGKELASKTEGNVTYFGAKDDEKAIGSDNCRFKVEYNSNDDKFTWTINENVSNFAPVQLSYQVKLVNRSTTAGTYTVSTNEYAKLTPKNSAGYIGKELEFNKPEVSYTVKNSSGGGGGGNSKPVVIPDKVPTGLNGDDHYAYIVGYPDSTVRPQNGITRAEVATIFFRLLTDEVRNKNSTKSNSYSDVASTDWYNHAVSTLSAMGIIKGDTHGKFNPNAPITRAEFAAIAARFDDKANTTTADFSDIASHWAKDEISAAANNGWINGYTDGTFRPNNNITRAEAMTLVNRVLKRLPETAEDLHDDMIKWTDNSDTSKWYYLAVQEATNSHYYDVKANQYEKWSKLRETRDWTELEK